MNKIKSLFVLLLPIAFFACKKTEVDQAKVDREIIRQYIRDNGITNADSTASGLFYAITDSGVGASPTATSTVWVYYRGSYTTGVTFDQSEAGTFIPISLVNVIQGWKEGIPLIKKGGEIKLFIPSALGYGTTGSGTIPGNTVLIFNVKLDNFQ